MYAAVFQLPANKPNLRLWVLQILDEQHRLQAEQYFPSMSVAKFYAQQTGLPVHLKNTLGEEIFFKPIRRRLS